MRWVLSIFWIPLFCLSSYASSEAAEIIIRWPEHAVRMESAEKASGRMLSRLERLLDEQKTRRNLEVVFVAWVNAECIDLSCEDRVLMIERRDALLAYLNRTDSLTNHWYRDRRLRFEFHIAPRAEDLKTITVSVNDVSVQHDCPVIVEVYDPSLPTLDWFDALPNAVVSVARESLLRTRAKGEPDDTISVYGLGDDGILHLGSDDRPWLIAERAFPRGMRHLVVEKRASVRRSGEVAARTIGDELAYDPGGPINPSESVPSMVSNTADALCRYDFMIRG